MDEHIQKLTEELISLIKRDEIEAIRIFLGEHQFHIGKVVRAEMEERTLLQHACLSSVTVLEDLIGVLGPKHLARQELTRMLNGVSVLHEAAAIGRLDVIRMLFEQRFIHVEDFELTSGEGKTVQQTAVKHEELVNFIKELKGNNTEDSIEQEDVAAAASISVSVDDNDNEIENDDASAVARAVTLPITSRVSVTESVKNKPSLSRARTLGRTILRILHLKSGKKEYPVPIGLQYDKVIKKLQKKSPLAMEILGILTFIDCEDYVISEHLRGDKNEKTFNAALAVASKYAFFELENGKVRLNQEVQDELLEKLANDEHLTCALNLLKQNIEQNAKSFMRFSPQLLNHAIKIWQSASGKQELVAKFAIIPVNIVIDMFNNGKMESTLSYANESLAILEKVVPDSETILCLKRIVAGILNSTGKNKEALELLDLIVTIYEERFPDNKGLLLAMHARAKVVVALGRYPTEIYENIISKMSSQLGEQNSATLSCKLDHACALLEHQEVEASHEILNQVCAELTQVFGTDDRRTLEARKDLAHALYCSEKYEDALEIYTELDELMTRVLGEEHILTLLALQEKAGVLLKLNNLDSSIRAYNEVHTSLQKQFGALSPKTLAAKVKLASAIKKSGKIYEEYPKPDVLYAEIIKKDYIDKHDPDILLDLQTRVEALKALHSEDTEILEAYDRLINTTIEIFSDVHPICFKTREQLAEFLTSRNHYDEAEKILLDLLQTRVRTLGLEHVTSLRVLEKVADIRVIKSNLEEALLTYSTLLDMNIASFGADNVNTLVIRQKRATTMRKIGEKSVCEADNELSQILEKMIEVLGAEHPNTLSLSKYIETIVNLSVEIIIENEQENNI